MIACDCTKLTGECRVDCPDCGGEGVNMKAVNDVLSIGEALRDRSKTPYPIAKTGKYWYVPPATCPSCHQETSEYEGEYSSQEAAENAYRTSINSPCFQCLLKQSEARVELMRASS